MLPHSFLWTLSISYKPETETNLNTDTWHFQGEEWQQVSARWIFTSQVLFNSFHLSWDKTYRCDKLADKREEEPRWRLQPRGTRSLGAGHLPRRGNSARGSSTRPASERRAIPSAKTDCAALNGPTNLPAIVCDFSVLAAIVTWHSALSWFGFGKWNEVLQGMLWHEREVRQLRGSLWKSFKQRNLQQVRRQDRFYRRQVCSLLFQLFAKEWV